jgi:hypothetical protein
LCIGFEYQDKIKAIFDRREDHGKHGEFDNLWLGPFEIIAIEGNNSFSLQNLDGDLPELPVNGRFLKKIILF